jgi:cell division inhibitor SulA/protein ImuA
VDESLEALLASARVWRAREKGGGAAPAVDAGSGAVDATRCAPAREGTLPTGWPALDAALPDAGWPLGTLIELLLPSHGVGELQLLLPALRATCGAGPASATAAGATPAVDAGRWLLWIAPPLAPYPPALAQAGLDPRRVLVVEAAGTPDRLWTMEQALQSRSCGAVLAWLDDVDDRWLRRLKLAAQSDRSLAVVFRPLARRAQASAAALRLALEPGPRGLDVEVLKSRGGPRHVRNVLAA